MAGRAAEFNLPQLLRVPFQALVVQLHAGLAEAGYPDVRPVHSPIFAHLTATGLRPTELAIRTQMTKQMVNYLLNDLQALGFVERVPDPTDRRGILVRLTPRGVGVLRAGERIIGEIEADWGRRLGEGRMQALRSELAELVEVVGQGRT